MFTDIERGEIEAVKLAAKRRFRMLLADLPSDTFPYFKDCILTGGCFASLFHGDEPNDWDVYLRDTKTAMQFEMFTMSDTSTLNTVKDVNPNYMVDVKVSGKVITANAITFNNSLQVITNTDKDHRLAFDFIHCMPYFEMSTQKLYISRAQYDAIKNKHLIKNDTYSHALSQKRINKFLERGWMFTK
jgi:hypothetical protein